MNKISVVVNTRNESKNIERCLKSVTWADEIVVVDMESEDDTVEKAHKYTDKVFSHPKSENGLAEPAKNFAFNKASNEWILILDADEVATKELKRGLKTFLNTDLPQKYVCVFIPRKNIIFGKWIKHGLWWPDSQYRFIKKGYVTWQPWVHASPIINGEVLKFSEKDGTIKHFTYKSVSEFVQKMNKYTDLEAQKMVSESFEFKTRRLIVRPLREFLDRYLVHRGYLDGYRGLILSLLMTTYYLLAYAKLWQITKVKNDITR